MIERLLLLLASLAAVSAGAQEVPAIRNELSTCAQAVPREPEQRQNLLLLPIQLTVSRSIGSCGCTSGAIRYRAYETVQGRSREMNAGVLNSIPRMGKSSDVLLVLNPDTLVRRMPPYRVTLSCAE